MAICEQISKRFRDALENERGVSEKKMMGGICFLLNGNMIGGADRTKDGVGRFMLRVGKENDDAAAALNCGQPMVQGGRRMSGFFFVDEQDCDDECLNEWMALALDFVKTLKPK